MLLITADGDGNCRGIYSACLTAAAIAGAAAVIATSGWGIPLAVCASQAAMEYCRQQYIGCVSDHQ